MSSEYAFHFGEGKIGCKNYSLMHRRECRRDHRFRMAEVCVCEKRRNKKRSWNRHSNAGILFLFLFPRINWNVMHIISLHVGWNQLWVCSCGFYIVKGFSMGLRSWENIRKYSLMNRDHAHNTLQYAFHSHSFASMMSSAIHTHSKYISDRLVSRSFVLAIDFEYTLVIMHGRCSSKVRTKLLLNMCRNRALNFLFFFIGSMCTVHALAHTHTTHYATDENP